jgi:glucose-6-phosphate isomerase
MLQALNPSKQVLFAGANTDPDELAELLALVDWNDVIVNVISKSGDTVEPMSAFLVARERLKQALDKEFASRIVATTDVAKGTLKAWSDKEGYHRLVVPSNVGGRYSVLSDVGLFPAAWAGIDIKKLRQGAQSVVDAFTKRTGDRWFEAYAGIHAELYQKHGRQLFVFMPYAAQASSLALWWCQLIGESLGKSKRVGPTPVAVQGATDQHSQLQLYMEGPIDKVLTFLEVERFRQDIRVPKLPMAAPLLEGLSGRPFADLIHAERLATAEALAHAKRPNLTLHIPEMNAFHLGELFQGFMVATGLLGQLLKVNAFDQPGVEDGKRRFRAWLHA